MHISRLCGPALVAAIVAGCSAGSSGPGPATPSATHVVVTTPGPAPMKLDLHGEDFVFDRTLPPDALSAEQLRAAGVAAGAQGEEVEVARGEGSGVRPWELVAATADGWSVWQPTAVIDTLAAAGAGATLVSVAAMEWPDACMGLATPGEVCAQVITQGYAIVIERGGARSEYHAAAVSGARRLVP